MASQIVVVASPVGGAKEILVDQENSLLFRPDDPQDLSAQIERLIENPQLCQRLESAGEATAASFDMQRMVEEIERLFADVSS